MTEEQLTDDQSHYEVSLTAGQAFLAFVLLMLSLAASFAFGLVIGKGNIAERMASREQPVMITESKPARPAAAAEVLTTAQEFKIEEEPAPVASSPHPQPVATPAPERAAPAAPATAAASAVPHYAQLFSSSDQKAAEGLAAKLIENDFSTAYVERGTTAKGQVYRVRVRFPSEEAARSAEVRLREFSKEVWITKF